jgi:hypothetical protein
MKGPLPISALTRAVGWGYDRVKHALAESLEPPKRHGRQVAVPPDIEQQTLE